jgi:predicted  nucleic acid-binding Zn-ribbon protein
MNAVLHNLITLQSLEFQTTPDKKARVQIGELRAQIPGPLLGHYDRLMVRGKKGVALVRNHTCTGCYMRQPIGKITTLMRGDDIQLCDSCGRYLYLPAEPELHPTEAVAKPKPAAKAPRRKSKTAIAIA